METFFDPPARAIRPKTMFLTGASGTVGQALLKRIPHHRVICLVRQTPVAAPGVTVVQGDITQPRLGLEPAHYDTLAESIDGIVHLAALTNLVSTDATIVHTNVEGTRRVLEFAAQAQVPVYHISTAFVHPRKGTLDYEPSLYERSKQDVEQVVRASGLKHVIVRPSIVVGDAQTGEIARFQGFHLLMGLFLRGLLPVLPALPHAALDFVPQDLVADIIATLVEQDYTAGEYWVTSGEHSLTFQQMIDICAAHAERLLHRPVPPPRMMPLSMFDRLIRPVFLPALPKSMQRTIERALDFSKFFITEEPFPCSLPELEQAFGRPLRPDLEMTFVHNLEYWVEVNKDILVRADKKADKNIVRSTSVERES